MQFAQWLEDNNELQQIVSDLQARYPQIIKLFAWENDREVHLHDIEIHPDFRNKGIGSIVIQEIKRFAASVGKPLTLTPEAQRGKKAALNRFYRSHGLHHNKGRKKDYRIGGMGPTMYWRPEWGE